MGILISIYVNLHQHNCHRKYRQKLVISTNISDCGVCQITYQTLRQILPSGWAQAKSTTCVMTWSVPLHLIDWVSFVFSPPSLNIALTWTYAKTLVSSKQQRRQHHQSTVQTWHQYNKHRDHEHITENHTVSTSNRTDHTDNHPPVTWAQVLKSNSTHTSV